MPIALPPLALEEITQSAEDSFAALNAMLREYNVGQVGPANHVPLWVFARDASGKVQGGVRGQTYWSWCAIDVLTTIRAYAKAGFKEIDRRMTISGEAVLMGRNALPPRQYGGFDSSYAISGCKAKGWARSTRTLRTVARRCPSAFV